MKLSELISFMQKTLKATNKELTCQDFVRDIKTLAEAYEKGNAAQYFWCVDRKGTYLTEHGKNAASFQNSAARYVGTYVISLGSGQIIVTEA